MAGVQRLGEHHGDDSSHDNGTHDHGARNHGGHHDVCDGVAPDDDPVGAAAENEEALRHPLVDLCRLPAQVASSCPPSGGFVVGWCGSAGF